MQRIWTNIMYLESENNKMIRLTLSPEYPCSREFEEHERSGLRAVRVIVIYTRLSGS